MAYLIAVLMLCLFGCGKDGVLTPQIDDSSVPAGKLVVSSTKAGGSKEPEFFFTNDVFLNVTWKDFCSMDCNYEFTNQVTTWDNRDGYYRFEYRHRSRDPWTEGWASNIIHHEKGKDEATVLTSIWSMYTEENISGLYDLRLAWVDEDRVATEVMVWSGVPINAGRDVLEVELFSDGRRNVFYSKKFAEKSLSFYFEGKTGFVSSCQQGETVIIKWSGSWGYGYREGDWISLSLFKTVSDHDYNGIFIKDLVIHYPVERGSYPLSTKDLLMGRYMIKMTGLGYGGTIGNVFEIR